jgi:orotidine-5'-phosphate decarboxylase
MTTDTRTRVGAERIAVALDVPTLDEAEALAAALAGHVAVFKVGLELFSGHGPEAVRRIRAHGPVFLDLKLHDIPTTVGRAARRLADLGIDLLTVHATGGPAMVEAAVDGLGAGGRVLAVTVLTSLAPADLDAVGLPSADRSVPRLAALATAAGAGGIVCAAPDLGRLRGVVPEGTALVTPGIRPAGAATDDQARVATPGGAVADGATLLVVGRPITRADDPAAAADAIADEVVPG